MSANDDTIEFDTRNIDELINEFDAAIYRATNKDVTVDPGGRARHNDPNKAQVSRELLRAADIAAQLESETRTLYWALKGFPDPRVVGGDA